MPSGTPTHIGPYPIERELGRGGMGVVYLARDPRLDRPVAIKVLPEAFVADPMRLSRFEREARTLAALNHRNVAMIFGLEEADSQRLLILEFVPGQTLTQRLDRGPIPLDETLRLCLQIAEGLEAAHERDIVHRDLKPDNVKVTPDGLVKVLDFGLATTKPQHAEEASTVSSNPLTQEGMVMGTPGYMSPEQARGLPTDKRADVWTFGCVLYECLSGRKAFGGATLSDCIAAVIDKEPDYSVLPARTPNRIRMLLQKCFVKDSRRRLRDIGDARIEIEDVLSQPQSGWYRAVDSGGGSSLRVTARLSLPLSGDDALTNSARGSIAVAPDGSSIAFVVGRAPQTHIVLRRIDNPDPRPLPGTTGADAPFFSPDGTKLAFFEGGRLKRVSLLGGAPIPLCPAPRHQGGFWDESDQIFFIPDWQKGLHRVSADGGVPESLFEPDLAGGELAHLAPEILPGSKVALISVWTGSGYDDALITAVDLRTKQRKPLIHGGCNPRFSPSGHMVFSRAGALHAVGFDPERLEIHGHPIPLEDHILGNALGGSAHYSFSGDGTLVYARGEVWEPRNAVLAMPRSGEPEPLTRDARSFVAPAISPSGRRLILQVQGPTDHLWLYDLTAPGATPTRLTFHADNGCPIWTPDGSRIAFRSNMSGRYEIYWMPADASGPPEPLVSSDRSPIPSGFTPDGRTLLYTLSRPQGGTEVWSVRTDDPTSAKVLLHSPMSVWGAVVSPDGKVVAYTCDETGRAEVYVQPFPGPGGRRQVSTDGGSAPIWARTGGELFFRTGDSVTAVHVAVEPAFQVGRPRPMVSGAALAPSILSPNYDAFPDSQRFVMVRAEEDRSRVTALTVVLNWFEELRRRVPIPQPTIFSHASRMMPLTPVPSHYPTASSTAGTRGNNAGQVSPESPTIAPPRTPNFPSGANTIG